MADKINKEKFKVTNMAVAMVAYVEPLDQKAAKAIVNALDQKLQEVNNRNNNPTAAPDNESKPRGPGF